MITVDKPIVNSDTILQYIPQRAPIVLISRIYKCDETSVVTGFDIVNESQPRVGFIANIKNLVINFLPEAGNEILTEVKTKTQVMNVSIIEANSYCNNQLVASCEMKIFLQENA